MESLKFNLINIKEIKQLSSENFKEFIIDSTDGHYNEKPVAPEKTGQRPSVINDNEILKIREDTGCAICRGVFLVTACARINNDKNNRYLILIDATEKNSLNHLNILSKIFKPSVKAFLVSPYPRQSVDVSQLSTWFRQKMGNDYSFIDIDFILIKNNKIVCIEEKTHNVKSLGYGQKISYEELYNDIVANKFDKKLMFVSSGDSLGQYYVADFKNESSQSKSVILAPRGNINSSTLSQEIINFLNS